MAESNMYADTQTWNPFVGCGFGCTYCVTSFQAQAKRQRKNCERCYEYEPHQHPERLDRVPKTPIVFVCGMGDISFCDDALFVQRILARIRQRKSQTFYLQSKRPEYFAPFLRSLPRNVVLVTTLETNRDDLGERYSKAPPPSERHRQFVALDWPRKVVTIEPVLDFDKIDFVEMIEEVAPEYVYLGYNSKRGQMILIEPSKEDMRWFDAELKIRGIGVKHKTIPSGVLEFPVVGQ